MLERVRAVYRQSKKRNDNVWTEWVSRPPAAVVVLLLIPTRMTPNQVTFASLFTFVGAAAVLLSWPSWAGLLTGAALVQVSYILDCVDGQLARQKNLSSPAGALLDFLVDEIKAFLLVAAVAVRLWQQSGQLRFLLLGIAGLVAIASGISLTTFLRRPEYLAAVGAPPIPPATDRGGHAPTSLRPQALVESAGRFALHYPSWLPLMALLDRLDLFLYVYLAAHVLSLGRASLIVLVKLGRPLARAEAARPPQSQSTPRPAPETNPS